METAGRDLTPSPLPRECVNTRELHIVAPGPVARNRVFALGRFPSVQPNWKEKDAGWTLAFEKVETTRKNKDSPAPPNWIVKKRRGDLRLQSRRDNPLSGSTYFILSKTGDSLTAHPVDSLATFRPNTRREVEGLSLEQAEAAMKSRSGETTSLADRLIPMSTLKAMKEEEAGLKKTGKLRLMDEEEDLFDDDGGLGLGKGGGRGGGRVKKEEGIDEDEIPEDIYAGEGDELRPEKPNQAEDWEHVEENADDDLDMGHSSDENLEDDPGERKKLGLEEDEDEELDESGKAIKKVLEKVDETEGGAPEDDDGKLPGESETGPGDLLDNDDDLDLDALVQTTGGVFQRSTSPSPSSLKANNGSGSNNGGGSRRSTTPPQVPPVGGVKRKLLEDPEAQDMKRVKTESPVPSASQMAATARPLSQDVVPESTRSATPGAAASQEFLGTGPPTAQEIITLLKGKQLPLSKITKVFKVRLTDETLKSNFKKLVLSLCHLVGQGGEKVLTLKEAYRK